MEEFSLEYLRAILLLGIAVFIWIIIKMHHPYANKSLEWVEGIVEGYTINAAFWSVIIGLAILANSYNMGLILHLVLLILFTKFFQVVSFIEVSSTFISIFWGLNKQSNGRLDYRFHVVMVFAAITVILAFIYLTNNLPVSSISIPNFAQVMHA